MIDLAAHGLIAPAREPRLTGGVTSISHLLDGLLAEAPDRTVLVGRSGRRSVSELDERANRVANALASLGVVEGTRVAASLPNDTAIVEAFLGAMRVGAIWCGINRPLAAPEKAFMLGDCGAAVFIGSADMVAQAGARRSELPDLAELVTVEPEGDDEWETLLAGADAARPSVETDPFAPAAIAYTSGTTGFPKGAVHTQHNLLLPGAMSARRAAQTGMNRQTVGVPLPLTILNLMILGPLAAYQAGHSVVAMDRIDAVGMADWIATERITTFAAVPAMVHDLLTHPDVTDEMLESIEAIGVGGADMPDAFRRLYEERFGQRVGTGYGLTEAPTSVTAEDVQQPPVPDSCGKALPQVEIRILDERGDAVPVGEVGEVCVAPASHGEAADLYRPMLGYWNRPEATADALRGGVLHTGDLGCLDADGNLFIKDRKHDLIIRGGANVYPAEVERVLHEEPGVLACAVVGVPDTRLGERVVAFIQPAAGAELTEDRLRDLCGDHLAKYKVPDEVTFVDEFDRTPMGKIRKSALRDLASG